MWEKFKPSSKRIIKYAHEEARHFRSKSVDTEHILLGILRDKNSAAVKTLVLLGADYDGIRNTIIKMIESEDSDLAGINFTKDGKDVLEAAFKEARMLKKASIGSEHLLLGLLQIETGKAFKVLSEFDVHYQLVIKQLAVTEKRSGILRRRFSESDIYSLSQEEGEVTLSGRNWFIDSETKMHLGALTESGSNLVSAAGFKMIGMGYSVMSTGHLLHSILNSKRCMANAILKALDADMEAIDKELTAYFNDAKEGKPHVTCTFSFEMRDVLTEAERHTFGLDTWIGSEHLLLGLLLTGMGIAYISLANAGITYEKVLDTARIFCLDRISEIEEPEDVAGT